MQFGNARFVAPLLLTLLSIPASALNFKTDALTETVAFGQVGGNSPHSGTKENQGTSTDLNYTFDADPTVSSPGSMHAETFADFGTLKVLLELSPCRSGLPAGPGTYGGGTVQYVLMDFSKTAEITQIVLPNATDSLGSVSNFDYSPLLVPEPQAELLLAGGLMMAAVLLRRGGSRRVQEVDALR